MADQLFEDGLSLYRLPRDPDWAAARDVDSEQCLVREPESAVTLPEVSCARDTTF
jgi:hypothetical protein